MSQALTNLRDGKYFARTVGNGTGARNSTIEEYVGGFKKPVQPPTLGKRVTAPEPPASPKPPMLPRR